MEHMTDEIVAIQTTAEWIDAGGKDFMKYNWRDQTFQYFVRPCYKEIYTILDDVHGRKGSKHNKVKDSRHTFITGTPGIGKSIFGLVLCRMLCDREKQILLFYETEDMSKSVFWDGRGYTFNYETEAINLIEKVITVGLCSLVSYDEDVIEIWSIGDSTLPIRDLSIRQICIASPGDARFGTNAGLFKRWIKNYLALTLALPPCSWAEILSIRSALFQDTAEEVHPLSELRARFELWGGVPRTILQLPIWIDENFEVQEFQQMRVKDAFKYLGTYNLDHQQHSGRIFHLYPCFSTTAEEYATLNMTVRYATARARYYWASEALERKAWTYFRREREAEVIEYILTTSNDPGSRGKAFEEHIHQLLAATGISGSLKSLESGEKIERFSLKPKNTMFFATVEDIDKSAEYWRPIARNYASLDGLLPANGVVLQMTVGKDHPINVPGLEKILKSGIFAEWENENPTERIKFVFVLDEENEEIDRKQSLAFGESEQKKTSEQLEQKKRRAERSRRQEAIEARIEQYALRVDLEGRLKELRRYNTNKRGRDEDEDSVIADKKSKTC